MNLRLKRRDLLSKPTGAFSKRLARMESTIYKPGAYKSPGIYKDARGVYNGRGVYNVGDIVEFGGIKYGFVKINNLLWTTENLRNETEGSQPTQNPTRENGRLYKPYYFNRIDDLLHDGWRIPFKDDLLTLQLLSTSTNDFLSKSLGGADLFGFNLFMPGYINTSNNYVADGNRCLLWSDTQRESNYHWNVAFVKSTNSIDYGDWSRGTRTDLQNTALSIRLCKDA